MMQPHKKSVEVIESIEISPEIFSLWIEDPEMAEKAHPGQFVSLYCKDGALLLPRPISICEIDPREGRIRLVYRVAGKGTKELSELRAGMTVQVMGPLGNGFTPMGEKALLIGGGIGIPPMLELAKQLNCEKNIVLGYRDILFLNEEFTPYGNVYLSTDDGSAGTKGNVIDAVEENLLEADIIYACGPTPMLRGIQSYAARKGITIQLSLEERMACGIGACLACTCNTKEIDHHTNVHNKRICKEGPVFFGNEVEL